MAKGSLRAIFTPFGITQLIMVMAIGAALYLAYGPWRLERAREEIRKRYPNISRVDRISLGKWLTQTEGDKPLLIDVRPKAEYDFSRLPGAKRMELSETPASLGIAAGAEASLVIYDGFGADASAVAARLAEFGYKKVQVLEGGIFEWANNGMLLEGQAGPSDKVKPGTSQYSNLLRRSHRAP